MEIQILNEIMKACVGMVTILPMWSPRDRFWHLHHVEFDIKFTFFWKINEIIWKLGWHTSYLVTTRWILFPNLLSLVWNSSFCWKFMQLHSKIIERHPIWWPFRWVLFLNLLSLVSNSTFCWKVLCKLHEKMVEICPIW